MQQQVLVVALASYLQPSDCLRLFHLLLGVRASSWPLHPTPPHPFCRQVLHAADGREREAVGPHEGQDLYCGQVLYRGRPLLSAPHGSPLVFLSDSLLLGCRTLAGAGLALAGVPTGTARPLNQAHARRLPRLTAWPPLSILPALLHLMILL